MKNELEKKKLILDQKEKEVKFNQLKHKEIVQLIKTSQQETESKEDHKEHKDHKRVIPKRGREIPKLDGEDESIIDDNMTMAKV